jgi:hypothetical protein
VTPPGRVALLLSVAVTAGCTEPHPPARSGSIDLSVSGVPDGAAPTIRVTGQGLTKTASSSGVIHELVPGEYTIRAEPFTTSVEDRFEATPLEQSVLVTASTTPVRASVAYVIVTGALTVNVTGLPPNASTFAPVDPVTITGPDGYLRRTIATVVLRGLKPGSYTVTAVNVLGPCPYEYVASPAVQTVTISAGSMGLANVVYNQTIFPPLGRASAQASAVCGG